MPELNLNGKRISVDDSTAQKITNLTKEDQIVEVLKKFWTAEKLGKHTDLWEDHKEILKDTLIVDPEEFYEDLEKCKLNPGNMSSKLVSLIDGTSINGDLKKEYITRALAVTTTEPEIGKGEFLFASIFKNIGFAQNAGDLVDLNSGKKIEVKGIGAKLGNGKNNAFKPMSKGLMLQICKVCGIDDMTRWQLDEDNAMKIKHAIGLNEKLAMKVFTFLQNRQAENEGVSRTAVNLYFEKKQLIRTVAAMHLYCYMKMEQDAYLLLVNDEKFSMFKAPDDLAEAYSIIEKMSVKGWREGDYGIKITLR